MEALKMTGRMDLVGFGEKCLIRPRKLQSEKNNDPKKKSGKKSPQQSQKNRTDKKLEKRPEKKKTIRNVHKRKG